MSEQQAETLLAALFLILVTSDFFSAYGRLFSMVSAKGPRLALGGTMYGS